MVGVYSDFCWLPGSGIRAFVFKITAASASTWADAGRHVRARSFMQGCKCTCICSSMRTYL